MSDVIQQALYAARIRRELVPKIAGSAVVVSIATEDVDVKFATELGLSIMLDKPIVAVVRPGAAIPDKLRRVADRIVEIDLEAGTVECERLAGVIQELLGGREFP